MSNGNKIWACFLCWLALAPLGAVACTEAEPAHAGPDCTSGVAWVEVIKLEGATELGVTACLAGRCLSVPMPVAVATDPPCRSEVPPFDSWAALWVCAVRVAGAEEGEDDVAEVAVWLNVADALKEGLADGDQASLTVASADGAILHEVAGPVTYRVDYLGEEQACLNAYASEPDASQNQAGAPASP